MTLRRRVAGCLLWAGVACAWAGAPYGQWVLVAIQGTSFSVVDGGIYAVDFNPSLSDGVGHVHLSTGAASVTCSAGALGAPAAPTGMVGISYRCYRFESFVPVAAPVGDPVTQSRDWLVAGLIGAAVLAGFALAGRVT